MSEVLEILLHVQDLEDRITKLKEDLRSIPETIRAENDRIINIKNELEGLHNRLIQIRKDFDLYEVDVKENEAKHERLNAQLFQVKTNEEYRAIQTEIVHLRKEKTRLEEKMIDLLEEEEEVKKRIEEEKARFKQVETEGRDRIAKLSEELKTTEGEMKVAEVELKTNLLKLPKDVQRIYEKVKKARGSAVARVIGQSCSGCHARVTPQVYNELIKADKIHFCEICGRFLVYEEKS
ncbi:MAG TPA: hypothetical protein EYP24_00360 [bacterium (Candidatus Stahlbacteria)]|nr:hypothetical protein [Candidatus Stahlbacteria bacterium]